MFGEGYKDTELREMRWKTSALNLQVSHVHRLPIQERFPFVKFFKLIFEREINLLFYLFLH